MSPTTTAPVSMAAFQRSPQSFRLTVASAVNRAAGRPVPEPASAGAPVPGSRLAAATSKVTGWLTSRMVRTASSR